MVTSKYNRLCSWLHPGSTVMRVIYWRALAFWSANSLDTGMEVNPAAEVSDDQLHDVFVQTVLSTADSTVLTTKIQTPNN